MQDAVLYRLLVLGLLLVACQSPKPKPSDSTGLQPYFGQTPPGREAERFAPNVVSVQGRYEYGVSFTPDLSEIYFSGNGEDGIQSVYVSKWTDSLWTAPKITSLTQGRKKNEFEAFVSPNGQQLVFAAYDSIFSDERIWMLKKGPSGWGSARLLDSPVNDALVFYPTLADNGDLFYTNISELKLYWAPLRKGGYPEALVLEIPQGLHGFIAPDQSFLLFDAPKAEGKDRDIHVCFKATDGSWSEPVNLGPSVNSDFTETCPSVSPDGKYLFFSRYNEVNGMSDIYWVDAACIVEAKRRSP